MLLIAVIGAVVAWFVCKNRKNKQAEQTDKKGKPPSGITPKPGPPQPPKPDPSSIPPPTPMPVPPYIKSTDSLRCRTPIQRSVINEAPPSSSVFVWVSVCKGCTLWIGNKLLAQKQWLFDGKWSSVWQSIDKIVCLHLVPKIDLSLSRHPSSRIKQKLFLPFRRHRPHD